MNCIDCGKETYRKVKRCRSCAAKERERRRKPPEKKAALVAWRYDCSCGTRAFSFDPHESVRLTCGHEVKRGKRFVYGES